MEIEINDQFKEALDLMENTKKNLFITGVAGVGKSVLLSYFQAISSKRLAILAPTGVAALNVKGETIHSFFGFRPDITREKVWQLMVSKKRRTLYRNLQMIIIDEVSMVRADLFDCIDAFLKIYGPAPGKPFGGVQAVFIGDLHQLPPVVTSKELFIFRRVYDSPYFFSARSFDALNVELVELVKVYRQKDPVFIDMLNAIRNNCLTTEQLDLLNTRVKAELPYDEAGYSVYLTTTNKKASRINEESLRSMETKIYTFKADIEGEIDRSFYPTDEVLQIGVGAQIMLLNNDNQDRWVNGSVGRIVDIRTFDEYGSEAASVSVQLSNGQVVTVTPFVWEIFSYYYNRERNAIDTKKIGSFRQLPLKLAFSCTVHKSQGKTFPLVKLDFSQGIFAHGQAYVALSRCTSLGGLSLEQPFDRKYILTDRVVVEFVRGLRGKKREGVCEQQSG